MNTKQLREIARFQMHDEVLEHDGIWQWRSRNNGKLIWASIGKIIQIQKQTNDYYTAELYY